MKKLIAFILAIVILGTILHIGAVPTIPPIPSPPPPPPETPEPSPGGVPIKGQQMFEVISIEPVMEGHAGSSIEFNLKVIQRRCPDLVVHLIAVTPDRWNAKFSVNDFDLRTDETVELTLTLFLPDNVLTEKFEIKIQAVGKAEEDSVELKDSATVTVMTYTVDVGVMNLQLSPVQFRVGENVILTVTVVNYTQRQIADVEVEFLANNRLISGKTVILPAGASQLVTFEWVAEVGSSTLVVKARAMGDSNNRNDTISQKIVLGSDTEQIGLLYQEAIALYTQGDYTQAQNLFSTVGALYTQMDEPVKALEALQYEDLCNSHLQAEMLMDLGEQAFRVENYEQAVQNFEQARDIYTQIGDTEKQNLLQQKLDEAIATQKSRLNYVYILVCIAAVAVIVVAKMAITKGKPAGKIKEKPERFST